MRFCGEIQIWEARRIWQTTTSGDTEAVKVAHVEFINHGLLEYLDQFTEDTSEAKRSNIAKIEFRLLNHANDVPVHALVSCREFLSKAGFYRS